MNGTPAAKHARRQVNGRVLRADAAPPITLAPALSQLQPSERDMRRKPSPALSLLVRMETVRRLARVVTLLALDFVGVSLAIFTSLALKAVVLDRLNISAAYLETRHILAFAYLITALLFARSGLYATASQRPGLARIVACLFEVTVVALLFAVVSGEQFSSFYIFYGSLAFALVYVSSLRYLYNRAGTAFAAVTGRRRRALLVGTGKHIREVAHALDGAPSGEIDVVGFISLTPLPDNGLRSLGTLATLGEAISAERIDEVIIADPDFPQPEAVELVDLCHRSGVRVRVAPSTMEILIRRSEFVPGESVPLFELKPLTFEGIDYALKRSFDVVAASLLLLAFSPLLVAVVIAIKVTSRGPILFRSRRRGIGQIPFDCLKFRTMYHGADLHQAALENANEANGALFKIRQDPRRTPLGRVLRRFSLDELPQLINVVRGEMSLVGPRPLPERDYLRLDEWHRKRYLVLPGITGLWQVSGRSQLDFDELVRLDFFYLESWSVALDLTIMLKTIPAVLTRRGAY